MDRLHPEAAFLIDRLGLAPHPEGGFFRETWRSTEYIPDAALPERYGGPRAFGTAILFLLAAGSRSIMHRLASDEVFHHYDGDPVRIVRLFPDGAGDIVLLGSDIRAGQMPQAVVPADCWQGLEVVPGGDWALLGTTVAPGFSFEDFEIGGRAELIDGWPSFAGEIARLTAD